MSSRGSKVLCAGEELLLLSSDVLLSELWWFGAEEKGTTFKDVHSATSGDYITYIE